MQNCTLKNKQFCFVKDPDLDLLIGSGSEKNRSNPQHCMK